MTAPSLPLFKGFFQVGYAVSDIDQAMALYRDRFGIEKFLVWREIPALGPRQVPMTVSFAMVFVDDLMIEFLQPAGGTDGFLRDILPKDGFAIRQHHLAYKLDTVKALETMRDDMRAQGAETLFEGAIPGGPSFFYCDTKPQIGHYSEYITLENCPGFFGDVPRY